MTKYPINYQPFTVDAVIFQVIDGELNVLLSKVASDPYRGSWALPGGYCLENEVIESTLGRVLLDKAGVDIAKLGTFKQIHSFDSIIDDAGSHAVSVAYVCLGENIQTSSVDDDRLPTFFPIDTLPELAYDQSKIVAYAKKQVAFEMKYSTIAVSLLPKLFTFDTLQKTYELFIEKKLDKANFRKRILSYKLLNPSDTFDTTKAYRPARFYSFKSKHVQTFNEDF